MPAGGQMFTVLSLGEAAPKVAAGGKGVSVGSRSYHYDGMKLVVSD